MGTDTIRSIERSLVIGSGGVGPNTIRSIVRSLVMGSGRGGVRRRIVKRGRGSRRPQHHILGGRCGRPLLRNHPLSCWRPTRTLRLCFRSFSAIVLGRRATFRSSLRGRTGTLAGLFGQISLQRTLLMGCLISLLLLPCFFSGFFSGLFGALLFRLLLCFLNQLLNFFGGHLLVIAGRHLAFKSSLECKVAFKM